MKRLISLLAVAVCAAGLAPTASAFPKEAAKKPVVMKKMTPGMKTMPAKKMMAKAVYVCSKCKVAYTPAQAMKMGYKDPMGHKMSKMTKLPPGVKMMGKMPMKGSMAPMKGKMPPKPM